MKSEINNLNKKKTRGNIRKNTVSRRWEKEMNSGSGMNFRLATDGALEPIKMVIRETCFCLLYSLYGIKQYLSHPIFE